MGHVALQREEKFAFAKLAFWLAFAIISETPRVSFQRGSASGLRRRASTVYEQLRIRFYVHQNFPGDNFGVSKIKVMQARVNKLQHFVVRRIGGL